MYEMPSMVQCDDSQWRLMQRSAEEKADLFRAYLGGVYVEFGMGDARDWVMDLLSLPDMVPDNGSENGSTNTLSPDVTTSEATSPSTSATPPFHAPPPPLHVATDPSSSTAPFHTPPPPPPIQIVLDPSPHLDFVDPVAGFGPILGYFHLVASQKRQEVVWTFRSSTCILQNTSRHSFDDHYPCNRRPQPQCQMGGRCDL